MAASLTLQGWEDVLHPLTIPTHHEWAQFLIQLLAYVFSTAVKLPRLRDLSSLPQGPCRRY